MLLAYFLVIKDLTQFDECIVIQGLLHEGKKVKYNVTKTGAGGILQLQTGTYTEMSTQIIAKLSWLLCQNLTLSKMSHKFLRRQQKWIDGIR